MTEIINPTRELSPVGPTQRAQAPQQPPWQAGAEVTEEIARRFAMPFLTLSKFIDWIPAFDRLPLAEALQLNAILFSCPPQSRDGLASSRTTHLAIICDPGDKHLPLRLEVCAGAMLEYAIAPAEDIRAYLARHADNARAVDVLEQVTTESNEKDRLETLSLTTLVDSESPAVTLVNSCLYDALRSGASDVHLESTSTGLTVRFRIDGVLDLVTQTSGITLTEQVISRIKVLAELDIAEKRVPQDGSFRIQALGREVDIRVSIMPSVHGEDAVIRILDKRAMLGEGGQLTLDTLGFDDGSLATLRDLLEFPHGMVLVTGPTGSGKTTTLYAALSETLSVRQKIVTIEDPVEYQLPGVLQIPVNEKKGLTFARGLRSILRHDPDTIMVGEIRDRETAEIAVQSALTGHLVLSTIHANSVFDVFSRLTHMGLDSYALASALNGIWAQRLIRLNCSHCRQPYRPAASELARLGISADQLPTTGLLRGQGCGQCRGSGYKGRHAVAEVVQLDDEIREMIVDRQPIRKIRERAYQNGTRRLAETALDLAKTGLTTLEEVRRVTLAS